MVLLASLFIIIGLVLASSFRDFMWFARFGSLVVGVGVVLISRPTIIGKDIKNDVIMAETGRSCLDPEHYAKLGQPVPDWLTEDLKSRRAVGIWGPIVTFTGTVVWGFGDLLNKVFSFGT